MATTLERETELDCIADALDGAADGRGSVVVVEGPAGIGKSRLVADARALAKVRDFGRLWAVGDELESAMPWAVVRQLVERSISRYGGTERAALLAGPAGAALAALERAPDGAAAPAAAAGDAALARTLHALWWVAADLAAARPLLITIDDAQWADAPSLRFLAHLARRIADLPIVLLVATRPPAQRSGALAELAAARDGRRLLPQPLSREATGELCAPEAVRPAPAVLTALHAASGGNPFLAGQLAAELELRGLAQDDPATADAIAGLGPATISRALLARLPLDAVALAAAAAVLGARSDARFAAALARIDAARLAPALDALVAGHVLAGGGEELRFVHPVVREAVLAELGPGEGAALHAAAAVELHAAGAPLQRVAAHLAAAPAGTLPQAAGLLREAAAQLLAEGDAATAARHLRRAQEEAPGDDAIAAELGAALLRARDFAAAREQLRGAARAARTPAERAERLAGLASATLALDGAAIALEELRTALDAWPPEAAREPPALALEARLATLSSYLPEAIERHAERLRAFADLPGTGRAQRTLLALLAQRGMYDVRPAAEVAELAQRALGDGAYAADAADGLIPWANAVNALATTDRVEAADAEVEHARRRLREGGGSPLEFAAVSSAVAAVAWRRGDVTAAEADAEAAVAALAFSDPGAAIVAVRAVAARFLVLAALERDDGDAAAAAVARFDADCPDAPDLIPVTRLRQVRAAIALARDDAALARRDAFELGEQVRAARIDTPSVPWRAPAAIALQRLGEEAQARALAAEQLALARRWGAASDVGASLRLNARVDPERRLELLEASIAQLETAPWRLELARALADYGAALRVARRRSDAREPLRRAAELADACGARALRARALDGLAALGDRPRKLMFSGADSLTASERRIAELASGGRSNRDIAQDLFVSPKTVENHLGRVYMKLGIKGRRELAAALT